MARLSVREQAAAFASEFGTTTDRVLNPRGRGARRYVHIRWALGLYIAERFAERRPKGELGLKHASRQLGMHHSTLIHAREFLPIVYMTRPGFERKVALAKRMIEQKEACNAALQSVGDNGRVT